MVPIHHEEFCLLNFLRALVILLAMLSNKKIFVPLATLPYNSIFNILRKNVRLLTQTVANRINLKI